PGANGRALRRTRGRSHSKAVLVATEIATGQISMEWNCPVWSCAEWDSNHSLPGFFSNATWAQSTAKDSTYGAFNSGSQCDDCQSRHVFESDPRVAPIASGRAGPSPARRTS